MRLKGIVVTIGREHGSGGRTVGKNLAKELGVPFYDREIVALAAKKSGLSEEYIRKFESHKPTGSLLYDLIMSRDTLTVDDQIYMAERAVIEQAAQESCVIVGRCADYVLKDRGNCLNAFVYAPLSERIRRVAQEYQDETGGDTAAYIRKTDKRRAAYYESITGKKWGDPEHYDLCVSTARGVEFAADLIAHAYRRMGGEA